MKCFARSMAKPTPGSLGDLEEVARFLLGTKHLALHLWRQTFPKCISTYVDRDFDGCRSTRRNTTGMVQMVGGHDVKHSSNLQGATGLNVPECEYHALTHGAAHGLGLRSYMADLGLEMSLEILSDSSARALASRRGLGRQRHVQTRYLWLQERLAAAHLSVQKVKTTHNIADILTEAAGRETLERHKRTIGLRHVDAHSSQKELRIDSVEHSHPMLACAFSSDQAQQFSYDKSSQYGLTAKCQPIVWIFEIYQRNVRAQRGPCFDVARVLGTREGDRRVDVCCDRLQRDIPHDWRKCERGSELFVTCILVQRHEATSQEGVKKYHLRLSIPNNSLCTHVVPLLFVPTSCVACFLVQIVLPSATCGNVHLN